LREGANPAWLDANFRKLERKPLGFDIAGMSAALQMYSKDIYCNDLTICGEALRINDLQAKFAGVRCAF